MARERIKYLLAMLIFGMNGVLAHYIPLTSAEIVVVRCVLGGIFLAAVFIVKKQRPDIARIRAQWLPMLLAGILMGVGWVLLFETYARAGVSYATLSYYSAPVAVMALSPIIFGEKFTLNKLLGMLSVAAGMLLINLPGLLGAGVSAGLLTGLAAAATYALMIIVVKRMDAISGLELTSAQMVIAFFVVTPYVLAKGVSPVSFDGAAIVCMLLLGLVNTGLACYIYFTAMRALPAQTVALCSYVDPASALIFSALFLGERMTVFSIAGAVLILGGAAYGELGGKRKRESKEAI